MPTATKNNSNSVKAAKKELAFGRNPCKAKECDRLDALKPKTAPARPKTSSTQGSSGENTRRRITDQETREQDEAFSQTQLLQFYRERITAFEKDRLTFYDKLEGVRLKQELVHKSEWELRKRTEEKAELEGALSRCQQSLYIERDQIMEKKRDCDNLRISAKENRNKILDLLQASNSVEQHVYYQQDQAPQRIQSYAKPTLGYAARAQGVQNIWEKKNSDCTTGVPRITIGSQSSMQNPQSSRQESNRSGISSGSQQNQPANILRTVYLPNERASQFGKEVDSLNHEIAGQRCQFEQVLLKIRDEKAAFEEFQREKYLRQKHLQDSLNNEIQELEIFNQQVVRDHVDNVSTANAEERLMQEELEAIRQENADMREAVRSQCEKTSATKTKAKEEYVANTQEYSSRFRAQSRIQQETISIIRDQNRKLEEVTKAKASIMQERLDKESEKVTKTESRRKLELEGYGADLQAMQRKIDFYHKYIGKLKLLVEEDNDVADLFTRLRMEEEEQQDRAMQENNQEGSDPQINIQQN